MTTSVPSSTRPSRRAFLRSATALAATTTVAGWQTSVARADTAITNDGVRLNIRPFMTAEVLRHNKKPKLNITWDKDRGKDVESAPWFKKFGGDRINDHHLTLAEKRAARTKAEGA